MLVSSYQDFYSPYESSRIELRKQQVVRTEYVFTLSYRQCKAYKEMVELLRAKMKRGNVYRLNVAFTIRDANISSFTGRTAHILFLKNEALMRMLLLRYPFLYQ
eukprot:TRINITY_DN10572_c0_g5_i1.p3 TRINITY_DN10572_c0_g5~~TRINITY_DN10572_c0_g5_i1.p3  ORF type:complete len:104 (+),score=21.52 TRINITY_DN10572_c0_g5_i1:213-524(+)